MSVEALRAVAPLPLKGPKKAVLMALAWHHGPTGCWPSWASLQTTAGCSRRTTARALADLQKLGHIKALGKTLHGVTRWSIHPIPGAASVTAMDQPAIAIPRARKTRGGCQSDTQEGVPERHPIPNLKPMKSTDPVKTGRKGPGKPDSLTLAEYLDTARLAGTSRKKSGQATKNRAGPLTIALGESRREPATGVAGIGDNATQTLIERI